MVCVGGWNIYIFCLLIRPHPHVITPLTLSHSFLILQQSPKNKNKAPLPSHDDVPIMGIKTQKNYITDNAVSAILSSPKSPQKAQENYLVSNRAIVQPPMKNGGNYTEPMVHKQLKQGYGKTPEYLYRLKEDIRKENELIESEIMNKLDGGDGNGGENTKMEQQILPEEERKELLVALKEKWEIVNSHYQKICHRTSLEQRQREYKRELESQLDCIESDMRKMESAHVVIV